MTHQLLLRCHQQGSAAPGSIDRVDVHDGDVAEVHIADDLCQSVQQSGLAGVVEGSDAGTNDAQHSIQGGVR